MEVGGCGGQATGIFKHLRSTVDNEEEILEMGFSSDGQEMPRLPLSPSHVVQSRVVWSFVRR